MTGAEPLPPLTVQQKNTNLEIYTMIYLLLAEGFEEAEALVPLDILRRGGLDVKTVGITGRCVSGAHGITVTADVLPGDCTDAPELLILPGGMPGTANLDASPETDRLLSLVLSAGGRVGAICAAPSILGKRGLLRGREAVCYPGFEGALDGAIVATKSVVTSGSYTTAIGMGAAYAFGLELLSLLRGKEAAERVAVSAHIPR
jgi:4-methyl-5(b-hydroxyethyl)-thiazole monophosphate biosynthesis